MISYIKLPNGDTIARHGYAGLPEPPQTQWVLELLAPELIIVGSMARGKKDAKDIDAVVKPGYDDWLPFAYRTAIDRWPLYCDISHLHSVGNLVINARPKLIDLFASKDLMLPDPVKELGKTDFASAYPLSNPEIIYGTEILVYKFQL